MSLYHYVASKNDLLNAIHESLLESLQAPNLDLPWQQSAEETVKAFVRLLREHPQAIPLFASRSAIAPGSLGFVDASLGVFLEAGFEPAQALMAFQSLFTFAVGHAHYHYGPRDSQSFASPEEYARFPHLARLASPTMNSPEQELDFGLQALLRGLATGLS